MLFYDEFEFIVTPFFCTIIFGSLPELFPRSARIMDLESNLRTADMLIAQSFCQGVGVKNRIATLAPVLLISLTIWACSGSDATTDGHIRPVTRSTLSPVPVQLDTGVISAGDSIVVSVWDAPQFDTHTSVRFNGAITLPFVGEIEVAGNRKDELARMLRQRLSEYVKGNISLTVEVFAPSPKISVFGMVARQGSFPANTSLSLVDALITAGGWAETADLRYIRITRQSTRNTQGTSFEFDLTSFLETGDMRGMPAVYPGDVVIVPKKENYVQEFSVFLGTVLVLFGFFNLFK